MGKSKAQDELKERLEELYPLSKITDEEYIGDLIKEQGYTLNEMKNELGHKPHKMFVDIIMRDTQRTIAFEYHGEQHFALIGNMTKTRADLLVNQMLDEEKSWILERIGIPLVSIPYDMYIDAEIIEQLITESTERVIKNNASLTECNDCQRFFPQSQLKHGLCTSCIGKEQERNEEKQKEQQLTEQQVRYNEEQEAKRKAAQREARREMYKKQREARKEYERKLTETKNNSDTSNLATIKEAQRKANREARREAYKLYKQSDEYLEQKTKAKEARKKEREAYKASPEYAKQKAEAKRKRREERERLKQERRENNE